MMKKIEDKTKNMLTKSGLNLNSLKGVAVAKGKTTGSALDALTEVNLNGSAVSKTNKNVN